jgi:hypothetical protein
MSVFYVTKEQSIEDNEYFDKYSLKSFINANAKNAESAENTISKLDELVNQGVS